MPVGNDYRDYVLEQLRGLPRVTAKRMFGGIGLYSDGLFFGLIDDDVLYLKVNDTNRDDYIARGMRPFTPDPARPDQQMSYYQVPAEILEDAEALLGWARKSVVIAAAAKRKVPRRRPTARKKK